jgi:hypothetical protein
MSRSAPARRSGELLADELESELRPRGARRAQVSSHFGGSDRA